MRTPSAVLAAALFCAALGGACGKKGPPLAPIVRVPAAVDQVSARRIGDDVYVTVTVPRQNIDASLPADVERVEVFGVTATAPPPRGRFTEIAELLETIPVAPPPLEGTDAAAEVLPLPSGKATQGTSVTIRDPLSPGDQTPRELPPARGAQRPALPGTEPLRGELRRFYLAIAFSPRGRAGPPGAIAELPLISVPEAPSDVVVTYTSDTVTVAWEPSGGLLGYLLDQSLPPEISPLDDDVPVRQPGPASPFPAAADARALVPAVIGPARYNVYRELGADPFVLPAPSDLSASTPAPPQPLNPSPLDALSFVDELEFERERCYVIRAVRGIGSSFVEGQASERHCVRPVDVFPPAPPVGLSAVASEGAISLIWEAGADADAAGYLILRGGSPDATLLPLTNAPIAETQFVDRSVNSGERYVYAVVAVDDRVPLPNVSEESMRVEETAR